MQHLRDHDLRLPSHAQELVPGHYARPDFTYDAQTALVFIDGPHHDSARAQERDARVREELDLAGYTIISFTYDRADWPATFRRYAFVFGEG